MTIAGTTSRQTSAQTRAQTRAQTGTQAQGRETRQGRALVAITPAKPAARPEYDQPPALARPVAAAAPFLAHLVAMRDQAPQTRARRRVEPAEATRIYRTQTMTTPVNGRQMSRVV